MRVVSGVYAIKHIASGRSYVGSSANTRRRWSEHKSILRKGEHHAIALQALWSEHGATAFAFEVLEQIDSRQDLITREQYWIDFLNSSIPERGFNLHPSADSPRGYNHSLETRANMSAARKGRKLPPFSAEHKARISAAKMGHKVSLETRAKMSAGRKGKKRPPFSAEHKARISAAKMGHAVSEEARAKMSAARKGKKLPPFSAEHKARLSAAAVGRTASQESRAKMSAARKGRKFSPEHAAKLRAILTIRNQSPEARAITAARNRSPEYAAKSRERLIAWNQSPEARARTAERNHAMARSSIPPSSEASSQEDYG